MYSHSRQNLLLVVPQPANHSLSLFATVRKTWGPRNLTHVESIHVCCNLCFHLFSTNFLRRRRFPLQWRDHFLDTCVALVDVVCATLCVDESMLSFGSHASPCHSYTLFVWSSRSHSLGGQEWPRMRGLWSTAKST